MRKFRIKSKVRFTLFAVITILVLITCMSTVLGMNTVSSASMDQYVQLKVESGDTIWNIAEEYAAPGTDVRKVVNDIYDINGISADQLQAGQNIIVPIYDWYIIIILYTLNFANNHLYKINNLISEISVFYEK